MAWKTWSSQRRTTVRVVLWLLTLSYTLVVWNYAQSSENTFFPNFFYCNRLLFPSKEIDTLPPLPPSELPVCKSSTPTPWLHKNMITAETFPSPEERVCRNQLNFEGALDFHQVVHTALSFHAVVPPMKGKGEWNALHYATYIERSRIPSRGVGYDVCLDPRRVPGVIEGRECVRLWRPLLEPKWVWRMDDNNYVRESTGLVIQDPPTFVHVILSVKNRGKGLGRVVENGKAWKQLGNSDWNLIVVDFESMDVDIEELLKTADIPSQLVPLQGKFSRSRGLQAGLDAVWDHSSHICFFTDADVILPNDILSRIRRYTVRGKQAFAPRVFMIEQGVQGFPTPIEYARTTTPQREEPLGSAATREAFAASGYFSDGLGIIGLYCGDAVQAGGFDVKQFGDRWGGEDQEFGERLLQMGMGLARIKTMGLYHPWHPRGGEFYEGTGVGSV